jgi:hypothetical protein
MKEISSMNCPQHGEVFYIYGQALQGICFELDFYIYHLLVDLRFYLLAVW